MDTAKSQIDLIAQINEVHILFTKSIIELGFMLETEYRNYLEIYTNKEAPSKNREMSLTTFLIPFRQYMNAFARNHTTYVTSAGVETDPDLQNMIKLVAWVPRFNEPFKHKIHIEGILSRGIKEPLEIETIRYRTELLKPC